jgi:hypothetical protein
VAVRADMTPVSGASSWVFLRRSSWAVELRLGRRHAGLGGLFLRQVLVDLLGADGAAALHGACAVGIGCGFCGNGLRLGYGGARKRHIRLDTFGGKACQQLAARDAVAHLGVQFCHAQAIGFSADAGFLPGGNAAIGCQLDGEHAAPGLGQGHGQCRLAGTRRFGGIGGLAAGGKKAQSGQRHHAGESQSQGQRLEGELAGKGVGWCVHGGVASHQ